MKIVEATEQKKEEEEEQEVEQPLDPETQALWDRLNTDAGATYRLGFEKLIKSDVYEANGRTYKFKMVKPKDMGKLRFLRKQKLDQEKDWDGYVENYRERACILIEDMTPDEFDNSDFYVIENLVTAWSIRATSGFRPI